MGHKELFKRILIVTLFIGAANSARATENLEAFAEPSSVDLSRVAISDTEGSLRKFSKHGIFVFIEAGSKCPILRKYVPTIQRLVDQYKQKGVQIFMVDSALHDSRQSAAQEAKDYGISVPVLMDSDQNFARALGFKMSSQSVVVNSQNGQIVYRGGIDDSLGYDGRKEPKHHYLKDAVEAALAGKNPQVRTARAFGCAITFK